MNVQRYVERPPTVEAARVTLDNFMEVAEWCGGKAGCRANPAGNVAIVIEIPRKGERTATTLIVYEGWWLTREIDHAGLGPYGRESERWFGLSDAEFTGRYIREVVTS